MKILKSIGLYFVYPFATFILGILTHIGYLNYFYPNKYTLQENLYIEEELITHESASVSPGITSCDTVYILTEYNITDNSKREHQEQLPDMYLGMTRESLESALNEYQQNPTLEDIERGFCSIQLESFSSSEVHISKIYQPKEELGYFLMVMDGKIVVMHADKETIYLTTDIYADALSDSIKQELLLGKYILDIDELYGFLESYTS